MPERIERYDPDYPGKDERFAFKIWSLLGSRKDMFKNDVDAFYFDYSALPEHMKDKVSHDQYLLYGVNTKGDVITQWINRWEFDNE